MTIILAKILGLYFVTIGLAIIINPERFKKWFHQFMTDESALLLGGILALLIGAFVISVHNVWVLSWPLIITLLGWWSLIKGFGLLVSSDFIKYFSFVLNQPKRFYQIMGLFWAILGLFLSYQWWK